MKRLLMLLCLIFAYASFAAESHKDVPWHLWIIDNLGDRAGDSDADENRLRYDSKRFETLLSSDFTRFEKFTRENLSQFNSRDKSKKHIVILLQKAATFDNGFPNLDVYHSSTSQTKFIISSEILAASDTFFLSCASNTFSGKHFDGYMPSSETLKGNLSLLAKNTPGLLRAYAGESFDIQSAERVIKELAQNSKDFLGALKTLVGNYPAYLQIKDEIRKWSFRFIDQELSDQWLRNLGLNPEILAKALVEATARHWAMSTYLTVLNPGFSTRHVLYRALGKEGIEKMQKSLKENHWEWFLEDEIKVLLPALLDESELTGADLKEYLISLHAKSVEVMKEALHQESTNPKHEVLRNALLAQQEKEAVIESLYNSLMKKGLI